MWQRIKTAIVLVIIVGIAMFASQTPDFICTAASDWRHYCRPRVDETDAKVAAACVVCAVGFGADHRLADV